ncbi:hypothetical protein ACI65C_003247 [Semiaphis heraclei]
MSATEAIHLYDLSLMIALILGHACLYSWCRNEIPSVGGRHDGGGLVGDSRLAASPKRTPPVVISLRSSSVPRYTRPG